MKTVLTSKFVKQLGKIKNKKSKEDTDKVLKLINDAKDFVELHNQLDIKKYQLAGGYRIRYSNNPEMRIKFTYEVPEKKKNEENYLQLLWVGTRSDFDQQAISMNESVIRRQVIIISESQYEMIKKHFEFN